MGEEPAPLTNAIQLSMLYYVVGGHAVQHQVLYRIMVDDNPNSAKYTLGGRFAAPKGCFG